MKMNVNFAGIKMKNPVTVASGTFGYGQEYSELFDIGKLGGIFTKGTSLKPRSGNPSPRIVETPSGMLNAVGLQNPGVEYFLEYHLPFLRKTDAAIIVNAIGRDMKDYVDVCHVLNSSDIEGVELNLSCPNVKAGCMAFGISYEGVKEVTGRVRKVLDKPLIVKLSPNVTDITETAKAAEDGGADGISLVNTFSSMVIDTVTMKPVLANNTGGLSGPAIRPIAVYMTYQVANAVKIPVLGMGGIISGDDAIQFMLAGAKAVSIGLGNFYQPELSLQVIAQIADYMRTMKIEDINEIVGKVKLNQTPADLLKADGGDNCGEYGCDIGTVAVNSNKKIGKRIDN